MKPQGKAMTTYSWTYTTWPDAAAADAAARILVNEGLCACANILPGMTSIYRWQGKVETASECVMVLKTTGARAVGLARRIAQLHPYDEPCILALPVDADASAPDFLAWIATQTQHQA